MPVSSVRRSTARVPSNAGEPLALGVTDPLSAVVFASKLPPTVIGQITCTSPCPTLHVFAATTVAPARANTASVDFIGRSSTLIRHIRQQPRWCSADEARRVRRASARVVERIRLQLSGDEEVDAA